MGVTFKYYDDLQWLSSWSGDELGYDHIETVNLFTLKNTNLFLYINMQTNEVLEYWDREIE